MIAVLREMFELEFEEFGMSRKTTWMTKCDGARMDGNIFICGGAKQ